MSDYLDFFAGGVPAGVLFKMSINDLSNMVELSNEQPGAYYLAP